jgi:hypothetical protein
MTVENMEDAEDRAVAAGEPMSANDRLCCRLGDLGEWISLFILATGLFVCKSSPEQLAKNLDVASSLLSPLVSPSILSYISIANL